jgi:hypothetical protein
MGLVRRELGADEVRVLDRPSPAVTAQNVLEATLPDGRRLVVAFAAPPPAKEALTRRLEMLVSTFGQSLEDGAAARPASQGSIVQSLRDQLRVIAARTGGANAVVIDATSPVIWGSAMTGHPVEPQRRNVELVDVSRHQVVSSGGAAGVDRRPADTPRDPPIETLTNKAIRGVRALSALSEIPKGRHLAHDFREADFACAVRSFAGIYVLIIVFDGPFDELRVERVIAETLPRVERLVLALPPLDPGPTPNEGVVSLRRRR